MDRPLGVTAIALLFFLAALYLAVLGGVRDRSSGTHPGHYQRGGCPGDAGGAAAAARTQRRPAPHRPRRAGPGLVACRIARRSAGGHWRRRRTLGAGAMGVGGFQQRGVRAVSRIGRRGLLGGYGDALPHAHADR